MNVSDPHQTLDYKPYVKGLRVCSPYAHSLKDPTACWGVVVDDPNERYATGWAHVLMDNGDSILLDGTRCSTTPRLGLLIGDLPADPRGADTCR